MRLAIAAAILMLYLLIPAAARASLDFWWMVGPMVHYDFGKRANGLTFGLELSHWWEKRDGSLPPAAFDVGVEWARGRS